MNDTQPIDKKIVFALVPAESNGTKKPVLVIGIPRGAWQYMKRGKTHHFDLTSAGFPVQIMMFGAGSHADAMKVIEKSAQISGATLDDQRRKDHSMKFADEVKP